MKAKANSWNTNIFFAIIKINGLKQILYKIRRKTKTSIFSVQKKNHSIKKAFILFTSVRIAFSGSYLTALLVQWRIRLTNTAGVQSYYNLFISQLHFACGWRKNQKNLCIPPLRGKGGKYDKYNHSKPKENHFTLLSLTDSAESC